MPCRTWIPFWRLCRVGKGVPLSILVLNATRLLWGQSSVFTAPYRRWHIELEVYLSGWESTLTPAPRPWLCPHVGFYKTDRTVQTCWLASLIWPRQSCWSFWAREGLLLPQACFCASVQKSGPAVRSPLTSLPIHIFTHLIFHWKFISSRTGVSNSFSLGATSASQLPLKGRISTP